MYPPVRNPASEDFVARLSPPNPYKYFLLAILWIVAALFLLATTGAPAQAVSGSVAVAPTIRTLAGNGTSGYSGDGGSAASAELSLPRGVAVDTAGNLYIADYNNNRIRKVEASSGTISTVAGNGTGGFNGDGIAATSAELNLPAAVAVDGAGNLYIADYINNRIRKVTAATGIITTVAGNGSGGSTGDGGPATSATLSTPTGVAVDGAGNLYIADYYNNRIRKVTASTGDISTFAGNGTSGFSGDGGPATAAELSFPKGVAVDGTGNVYIADFNNNRIREVTATTGNISTVAGDGTAGFGGDGGAAVSAELGQPYSVAVDTTGNLYIADYGNNRIRKVTAATGDISTAAGNGIAGYSGDGGLPTGAELQSLFGVAVDGGGNLYIDDSGNDRIRKVAPDSMLPPTAVGATSAAQMIFIQLTSASAISGMSVPKAQNHALEFTVGSVSGCVMDGTTINPVGTICTASVSVTPQYPGVRTGMLTLSSGTTFVGSVGLWVLSSGPLGVFEPGAQTRVPTSTPLNAISTPLAAAVDAAGNVYIADSGNNRVVEVTPNGTQTTVESGLAYPYGVAVDGAGNVFIAGGGSGANGTSGYGVGGAVLVVSPAGTQSSIPANVSSPGGVAVDGAGNVYISDSVNNDVIEVQPGNVQITIPATGLVKPGGVTVDGAGNVYIVDTGNKRVVKVTASGVQTTVGSGLTGPVSVAVDAAGEVYIADRPSNRVVEVTPGGVQTTLQVSGLSFPSGVVADGAGNIYVVNTDYQSVVEISRSQPSLNFATTGIGETSVDSPQTVTLENIGNQPLTISVPAAGLNPNVTSNFTLGNGGTCPQLDTTSSAAVVASGSSCALLLSFTPMTLGSLTGTASITDNSLNATPPMVQQIALSGTAVAAATTTTLTASASAITAGQSVTFTASVKSGTAPVTSGTVTFLNGATPLGTGALNAQGIATFTSDTLPVAANPSFTASFGATAEYMGSTSSAVIVMVAAAPAAYTLASSASSLNIAQGQTGAATLTLTSTGGFIGTVSFSCQNLPANAACLFAPNPVTLAASQSVSVALTVQTDVQVAQLRASPETSRTPLSPILPALAFWWPGGLAGLAVFRRKRLRGISSRQTRLLSLCVLLLASAGLAAGLAGCGGGSSTASTSAVTPTGTRSVTVVATNASASVSSQSVILTVNITQ